VNISEETARGKTMDKRLVSLVDFRFQRVALLCQLDKLGNGLGIFVNPRVPFGSILDRVFRQKACMSEAHKCATWHRWHIRSFCKALSSAADFDGTLSRKLRKKKESQDMEEVES